MGSAVNTMTLNEAVVDIETEEITDVDRATRKRRYNDENFIPGTISHQKLWNVENLRGKIRAFVLVKYSLFQIPALFACQCFPWYDE